MHCSPHCCRRQCGGVMGPGKGHGAAHSRGRDRQPLRGPSAGPGVLLHQALSLLLHYIHMPLTCLRCRHHATYILLCHQYATNTPLTCHDSIWIYMNAGSLGWKCMSPSIQCLSAVSAGGKGNRHQVHYSPFRPSLSHLSTITPFLSTMFLPCEWGHSCPQRGRWCPQVSICSPLCQQW